MFVLFFFLKGIGGRIKITSDAELKDLLSFQDMKRNQEIIELYVQQRPVADPLSALQDKVNDIGKRMEDIAEKVEMLQETTNALRLSQIKIE